MKLIVYPPAAFSRKVLLAAYEKNLPFQREIFAPFDAVAKEQLKAIYPIISVPLLVLDDGRPVPESSIIVETLELMFPAEPRLIPTDPNEALEARAFDWLGDHLLSATTFLAFTLRKPPEARNLEKLETTRRTVDTVLDILDRTLATHPYLCGNRLTFADLGPASAVATLLDDKTLPSTERWVHATRWLNDICGRPTWKRVLADVRDTPPPPWVTNKK